MKDISQLSQQKAVATTILCDAVSLPRSTYYRHQQQSKKEIIYSPSNALSTAEKQCLLDTLHDDEYVDMTPYQVYYSLLDKGIYLGSIRTMYRLLKEQGESIDRRDQRNHRDAVKPELIAQQPNEVWTWDITKLLSTQRLTYYYLYVILDIFSRYVIGWMLANNECQHLAKKLIQTNRIKTRYSAWATNATR